MGPTGAGKTTLVSLLARLYDPQEGRILVDGRRRPDDQAALAPRARSALVLQEPLLFSGTIAENIRYGRLDATEEEISRGGARGERRTTSSPRFRRATTRSLGERGASLSGGERQRICVARAFIKDAPILILDEPTSSIDSKTEAVILDALDRSDGRADLVHDRSPPLDDSRRRPDPRHRQGRDRRAGHARRAARAPRPLPPTLRVADPAAESPATRCRPPSRACRGSRTTSSRARLRRVLERDGGNEEDGG